MSGLLAAGAGASDGLETLLARMREEELMNQHQQTIDEQRRSNQANEAYRNRALDVASRTHADAERDREAALVDKTVSMQAPGDPVSEQDYTKQTSIGGVPGGAYNITPAKSPMSTIGFSSLPDVKPQGLPGATPGQGMAMTGDAMRQADPTSSMTAPRTIAFRGTGAQRQAATKEADTVSARNAAAEARLNDLTNKANEAWARIQQQGQTADAMAAFHTTQTDLERAKLELERERNKNTADKTPKPEYMTDAQGNWHAVIFDKGAMKEVPMPPGFQPQKPAPVGMFDRISHFFGSGSSGSTPPSTRITDPNWGKPPGAP